MTVQDYHFRSSIRELTPLHPEFPERLRNINQCPSTIYVRGMLPSDDTPSVAIIGARDATEHGKDIARTLGAVLAQNGLAVISGMAYGIDTAAHWGALDSHGKTYAVFGCGLDICYPPSNFNLYESILKANGGFISERPLGSPPLGKHFASRNRIISALADVIIVVEAKARSGTFITVGNALDQGKQVFAVPGRITDRHSEGCNQLIRDGASILSCAQDILDYFEIYEHKCLSSLVPDTRHLPPLHQKVYSVLSYDSMHIDEIAAACQIDMQSLSEILLEFELQNLCESPKNAYFRKSMIQKL